MPGRQRTRSWDRDEVHEIYASGARCSTSTTRRAPPSPRPGCTPHRRAALRAARRGSGQAFNFDLLAGRLGRRRRSARSSTENLALAAEAGASSTWVLSNHDVVRHATRYGLPQTATGRGRTRWLLSGRHRPGARPRARPAPGPGRDPADAGAARARPTSTRARSSGLHEVADLPADGAAGPDVLSATGGAEKGRDGCRVPLPWTDGGPSFGFGAGRRAPAAAGVVRRLRRRAGAERAGLDAALLHRRARRAAPPPGRRGADVAYRSTADVVAFERPGGWVSVTNFGEHPVPMPEGRVVIASRAVDGLELPGRDHRLAADARERDGPPDLHRAAAGRELRRPARRRAAHRGVRLRGVLPLRPLPRHGRRRPARADRLVGDARRAGARDVDGPARHAGHVGDVPASRAARDQRRAGRRDERRPGRARAGRRLVRGRARRVRAPFPDTKERFDRFEEQLAVITGLWRTPVGERFSFDGEHYTVTDSPALPKPMAPDGPPIIVGGHGKRRTPTARGAVCGGVQRRRSRSADVVGAQFDRAREACDTIGRDPGHAGLLRGAHGLLRPRRRRGRAAARRPSAATSTSCARAGSPARPPRCVETIGRYASVGAERLYLQVLDLADLDHLDLLAAEVMPHL